MFNKIPLQRQPLLCHAKDSKIEQEKYMFVRIFFYALNKLIYDILSKKQNRERRNIFDDLDMNIYFLFISPHVFRWLKKNIFHILFLDTKKFEYDFFDHEK